MKDAPGGTGVQGMIDRLEAVGGTLELTSAPGEGTTVSGRLPLAAVDVRVVAAPLEEGVSAPVTEWWREAVIYQIYTRSFADANGDGVGDLAGVRDRLPYLRELGIDGLWFNPWYPSPGADNGYDISDYRSIDPAFGTLPQAEGLIADARCRQPADKDGGRPHHDRPRTCGNTTREKTRHRHGGCGCRRQAADHHGRNPGRHDLER